MDRLALGLGLLSHLHYLRYLRYLQYLRYIALLHPNKPSRGIKPSGGGTILKRAKPLSAHLPALIKLANILKRLHASPLLKVLGSASSWRKILANPRLQETLRHLSERLTPRVGNRRP